MSRKDIINLYMAIGGVALYWTLIDRSMSVNQNINHLFFGNDASLSDEFDELYRSLFKKPKPYIDIVTALGKRGYGLTRNELVDKFGFDDNGSLSKCLDELENCDIVRKYAAYGKKSKGSIYQLIDNYTLFYFKFLHDRPDIDENFWLNSTSSQ